MPTYDYKCTKCGYTFEIQQRITEDPLKQCPRCKGAVRRLVGGGIGVIFKGSGFYTTDYKKSSALTSGGNGSSKEKTAAKPSETPSTESKKESTTTEKKPAT